jgi:hypothetical protein
VFQYENNGVPETSIWPTHLMLEMPAQDGTTTRTG